jgi:hypothetical protein
MFSHEGMNDGVWKGIRGGGVPGALIWANLVLLGLFAKGAGSLAAASVAHAADPMVEVWIPPPEWRLCDVAVQAALFDLWIWLGECWALNCR